MRTIYRIAKLELNTLFYSPVAWLILVIFTFQAGLQFLEPLTYYDSTRQVGHLYSGLTSGFFYIGPGSGFNRMMLSKLYLYIPLLTMGLMSRETSTGSIKLLLSSPVRMREIIFGKYLAMMAYGLALCAVLGLFYVTAACIIKDVDVGFMLSGLIAAYLLICAYSAIGLLMSCLTSYQIVAAVSTLAVLAALNYIDQVGQHIEIVREITYFLSISGRSDDLITGLINSRDIVYYMVVVALFLGLSILKLQSAREFKPVPIKVGRYALLIGSILLAGYLSSRPQLIEYADLTVNKKETISETTQKIIDKLDGAVKFTSYVNLLDDISNQALPQRKNEDLKHFEKIHRFLPNMKIRYVYYYDTCENYFSVIKPNNRGLSLKEVAKKVAEANDLDVDQFLSPQEIKKEIDLSTEGYQLVRTLEVNGKKTWLRMYYDMTAYPSENEFGVALKRLEVVPPKVGYLVGHNERGIRTNGDKDFKVSAIGRTFRHSLINQGFDVTTVNVADRDIPTDISILVIADPRSELSAIEQERINAYIAKGGNLLLAGEPGKQQLLNPILAKLGVEFANGLIIEPKADAPADYIAAVLAPGYDKISAPFNQIYQIHKHSLTARVTMPTAMTVKVMTGSPFNYFPMVVTQDTSSIWSSSKAIEADIVPQFTAAAGDMRGPFPIIVGLKRKVGNKEQRIVVSGDADFLSNGEMGKRNTGTYERINFKFYNATVAWLGNDEFPLNVARQDTTDNDLLIGKSSIKFFKILFLGIAPGILILWGGLLLLWRKRR